MKTNSSERPRVPTGIFVLALFIFITSLIHMQKLIQDYDWYQNVYSYLPPWLRHARYAFSWLQRILGLVAAWGLWRGYKLGRLLMIGIGLFTMLFVAWKHPYNGMLQHMQTLDQEPRIRAIFDSIGSPDYRITSAVWPALIVYYLLEIAFWTWVIRYLSRPHIRAYFR